MLETVERFKELIGREYSWADYQGVDIVIACAVSHKLPSAGREMLWLRIVGASGAGKTELLRALIGQEGFVGTMESITPGSIRRGYKSKEGKKKREQTLLERINGSLIITKDLGPLLTKDIRVQTEVFGLLRSVYDGTLDADYGSDQGHLKQDTWFDWVVGTTGYLEKVRSLEYLLGSRFIDMRWISPDREGAAAKAIDNDGVLTPIRARLVSGMADILDDVKILPRPRLNYIATLANISATLRTPVDRDVRTREIADTPAIEVPTRMGQALSRIATGLLMMGVKEQDIKPYLVRLVFDSMKEVRANIIKAWIAGLRTQSEVAARVRLSQGAVSRAIEEIMFLGWKDEWLDILISPDTTNYRLEQAKAEFPKVLKEHPGLITTVVEAREEAPGGMPAIDKRLFDGFLSTFGKLPDDEQSKVLAWVLEMAQVGIKQRKASQ